MFKKRVSEPTVKEKVIETEPFEFDSLNIKDLDSHEDSITDSVKETPYLEELPKAEPIKVFQLQQLFHPSVYVYIKPNNHKLYWKGESIYIPSSFYNCDVKDMSLRKNDETEPYIYGSVGIFIDKLEIWEKGAIERELDEINEYYKIF